MKYRSLEDRLMFNSALLPDTQCWFWLGYKNEKGYGKLTFWIDGRPRSKWAHRVSYECFIDKIPPGLEIDHTCNNPSCINPSHMRLLDKAGNVKAKRKQD